MRNSYWVTFHGRKEGCVEASSEAEALRLGEEITGYPAAMALAMRYPAEPRINPNPQDPDYCPSLCYRPAECSITGGCTAKRPCND